MAVYIDKHRTDKKWYNDCKWQSVDLPAAIYIPLTGTGGVQH